MKDIILLGGPNGAGKSTAAKVLLPHYLDLDTFLNADEIARLIAPGNPDSVALTAGRRLIERMRTLVSEGRSFALETTCAGKSYLPLLEQCRRDHWRITLLFFWLPSSETAVERVARRVSLGGHGIPAETIHRRYRTGIGNMFNLYLPLANEAEIYDNSLSPRVLIAEKREGHALRIYDPERWRQIEEMAQ